LELGGHDRLVEQRRFLDWLLETCRTEAIDALLVCGDVYDVANPSVAAQSAFAGFLVEFHQKLPNATVVVVAGNHDSPSRLELPRPFGEALGGMQLRGLVAPSPADHLVALKSADGAVGAYAVALPFLRAGDLDCRLESDESPQDAYLRAVAGLYRSVRESVPAVHRHLPLVAMGHLTLAGSRRAGSERILIGGVESVPVDALAEECAYVALGHIHRAQTVGTEIVRYCGAPYPVDFDEHRYRHRVVVVDVGAQAQTSVREIDVPEFVAYLRFCDPPLAWEEVERAVEAFDWAPWKGVTRALQPLVELRFDAKVPVGDLRTRCEALCRDKPFRLIGAPKGVSDTTEEKGVAVERSSLRERGTPEDLLVRFWRNKFDADVPEAIRTRFREASDEVAIEGGGR
jgi:DNA repair protein SbcD/Mre11